MKKWPMLPKKIVITPVFVLPVLDPDNEGPIFVEGEPITLVAKLEPLEERDD